MNVLGVIPARGGSKSVPRKNIAPVRGKPLLVYTIQAAKRCQRITHFVVSSEDPEIIAVAKRYGAPVPFVRPAELAADETARMRQIVDDRLVELPIREPKEMLRRQDLPPVYIRNGAVYAVRREIVMEHNSMVGQISRPYIMPDERSINVDSKLDLLLAEILLSPQYQSG
ncbi:MAG: acylneuraminate cytidylyltransferase family protein [Anaerolineales bacterium]